ncbi:hypothetical protein OSTOST_02343 [Ostertagia ostertagi]
MESIDLEIQLEPINSSLSRLREDFNLFTTDVRSNLENLGALFHRIEYLCNNIQSAVNILLERSTPRSNCTFCPIEDNKDNHPTGRCHKYPNPVARAIRASALRLCHKCLQPIHQEDCGTSCASCGNDHNTLLCPNKPQHGPPRKRKF